MTTDKELLDSLAEFIESQNSSMRFYDSRSGDNSINYGLYNNVILDWPYKYTTGVLDIDDNRNLYVQIRGEFICKVYITHRGIKRLWKRDIVLVDRLITIPIMGKLYIVLKNSLKHWMDDKHATHLALVNKTNTDSLAVLNGLKD